MSVARVAQVAGVSASTVSRVLNRDPRIKPQTASAVRKAIAQVGYMLPPATDGRRRRSKSLAGRHTNQIVVLFPDPDPAAARTLLAACLVHGVELQARRENTGVLISRMRDDGSLPPEIDRRQIDGVVIRASRHPEELDAQLGDLPFVWAFDVDLARTRGDVVCPCNQIAGELPILHFAGRKVGQVLIVDDIPGHIEHGDRCRAAGLKAQEIGGMRVAEVRSGDLESLVQMTREAIASLPKPLGIFMPGTSPAVAHICRLIDQSGLALGRDVELISCEHDVEVHLSSYPGVGVVDLRFDEVGRCAMEALYWRMANPDRPQRRLHVIPRLRFSGQAKQSLVPVDSRCISGQEASS